MSAVATQQQIVVDHFAVASDDWGRRYETEPRRMSDLDLHLRRQTALAWLDPACRACAPAARVLDVGCGGGNLLEALSSTRAEMHGVDIVPEMVAAAGQRLPRADLRVAPAERLPYPDGHFHAVSCLGVLEYLDDPAIALHEIRRVLSTDGILVVSFPNRSSWLRRVSRLESRLEERIGRLMHPQAAEIGRPAYRHRDQTPAAAQTLLRECGFDVRDVRLHTYGLWGRVGCWRTSLRLSTALSRRWSVPAWLGRRLACTQVLLAQPRGGVRLIRLLYLASPSYSGSTLLTLMLNESPGIATVGELKWGDIDVSSYRCSCDALLTECRFWQAVQAEVAARGLPFPLRRPPTDFRCREAPLTDRIARSRVRGPMFEAARSALLTILPAGRRCRRVAAAVNRAAIEAITKLQDGDVFLDASKDPVRLHHLAKTGDYDIRVVQLIRDGRGVVNSALKHAGGDPRGAALEWRRTHAQIERVALRLGPDRLMRLRYEDLCTDPVGTIEHVCAFAKVSPPRQGAAREENHVLGNAMRLRPLDEVKPDQSWREALSVQAVRAFEAVAGRTNAGYGYV